MQDYRLPETGGVMSDKKEAAIEAVRLKTAALREFMSANDIAVSELKTFAEMLSLEAELVRSQWFNDKNA